MAVSSKEILKAVRQIELSTRQTINNVLAGAYHSAFKGNGVEFQEVREYIPGDDVRSIDWNVTARTGKPYIKKYVEERELTLMLMVDASSSSYFGTVSHMKHEVMATLAAMMAFAAIRNNDKVGLIIFTSEVELYIAPAKGKRHVMRLIRELLFFKPRYKATRMDVALEFAARMLKRHSVIALLSDFQEPSFVAPLKILRRRHDLLALEVLDPRELELPDMGLVELEDPETGETLIVNTSDAGFRAQFSALALSGQRQVKKCCRELAIDYVPIQIQEEIKDTAKPLVELFRRRAKEATRAH
jgi:uncharacterized protein (DUF58 family)